MFVSENLLFLIIPGIIGLIAVAIFFAWRYEKKRRERLKSVAESLGFTYMEKNGELLVSSLDTFHLFSQGRSKRIYNLMKGKVRDADVTIMDYRYTTGSGKNSNTFNQTVILFDSEILQLPAFALRPENVFHKLGSAFGYQDIDFDSHQEFSRKYLLRGADETAVRNTFNYDILTYCESQKNICLEGEGARLIFYRTGKRISPEEIKTFLEQGLALFILFK
jgi:hypothetical protein